MGTAVERFDEEARRKFDAIGRNEVYPGELLRHRVYTRFLHWMVALFFFLALFSGFGIYLPWLFRWFTPIFGGGALSRELHPWFGLAFVFFFALQMLNWLKPMRWTPADSRWIRNIRAVVSGAEKLEPPDTGFFNAGQKVQFWEIVAGCAVYLVTGFILWFGGHVRTAHGGSQLRAARYFSPHHVGRNFHSHLSQHNRRAGNVPVDDSRGGE